MSPHIPVVVILGRINSGKSTLFNRLVTDTKALTSPVESTTRDANEGFCFFDNKVFKLVDTAGLIFNIKTELDKKVNEHIKKYVNSADLIIFLLDGRSHLTDEDKKIAQLIRELGKRCVVAVNKVDPGADETLTYEYYELGMDQLVPISAEHGLNIDGLLEAIDKAITLPCQSFFEEKKLLRFGIVGMPNAGKTSLLNNLAGSAANAIVDEFAGTTRDLIAREIKIDDNSLMLIDTPGIKKGRKKSNLIEHLTFTRTKKLLRNVNFAIFIIDATKEFSEADNKIALMIKESECGCLIVLNKWDIAENRDELMNYWEEIFSQRLRFLNWAPFVAVSAKTSLKLDRLKKLLLHSIELFNRIIDEHELKVRWKESFENRIFRCHKRMLKISGIKQHATVPALFEVRTSKPSYVHFSLKRQIENWLREQFDFAGVPIVLRFRR